MSKKNTMTTTSDLPALKIGSRVRCTDDGITGRITWANGVSVKIKWDDGEMVTWRRDELSGKPIEILAVDDEPQDERNETQPETVVAEQVAPIDAAQEQTPVAAEASAPDLQAELEAARPGPANEQPETTPAQPIATGSDQPPVDAPSAAVSAVTALADPAKPKRQRKAPAEPKEKKVSALDAAARVLTEAGTAMTCKEMIGAMAAKGYWSSPGGQTPDATLCSAILREIKVKGEQSRFVKAAPGRFAARPTA